MLRVKPAKGVLIVRPAALVMPSVADTPLSVRVKVGPTNFLSSVKLRLALALLPAVSRSVTTTVCAPLSCGAT